MPRKTLEQRSFAQRKGSWPRWSFSLIVAAVLIGTVLHFGEIENFAQLLASAQPLWLCLGILLQVSTYASLALGWSMVLHAAGTPRALPPLMRIAVTKLFADQVVPSAGMGGNILLVDQLTALGVSRGTAVAVLLVSMVGFYAAYALVALAIFAMFWLQGKATDLMAVLVTVLMLVAVAVPSLALWLHHRGSRPLPPRLDHSHAVRSLLETVAQAPDKLIGNRRLLLGVASCNMMIFLADGATLWACLHALGQTVGYGTPLMASIMASIVVTLGPIPLGLGTFEATSTATLHLLGIPVEAAFTATVLLRILTLWLPLVPGMVLLRKMLRRNLGTDHLAGE